MIDIRAGDTTPRVEVDPKLMPDLTTFHFDAERYAEGLALAEVPLAAIDTMVVQFQKSPFVAASARVDYRDSLHTVNIALSPYASDGSEEDTPGLWNGVEKTVARGVNYRLAETAQNIADILLKEENIVGYERLPQSSSARRISALGVATTTGGLAGSEVSAITGAPTVVGGILGMCVGAVVAAGSLLAWDRSPSRAAQVSEMSRYADLTDKRARTFANSQEAFDLFSGVVQIEFK